MRKTIAGLCLADDLSSIFVLCRSHAESGYSGEPENCSPKPYMIHGSEWQSTNYSQIPIEADSLTPSTGTNMAVL